MTWWNWSRVVPASVSASGQCTIIPLRVPPQCEAICLVHWYGVHSACGTFIVVNCYFSVELPGIEPGSYGIPSRLLRAQFALPLLGSLSHAN
jgi:hypothetical protein